MIEAQDLGGAGVEDVDVAGRLVDSDGFKGGEGAEARFERAGLDGESGGRDDREDV